MDNPIKLLRESAGLSMSQLASLAGTNKKRVLDTELGFVVTPSPDLLRALNASNFDYSAYEKFQIYTRQTFGAEFFENSPWRKLLYPRGVARSNPPLPEESTHTLEFFTGNKPLYQLQKAFCLPSSTFYMWKNKPWRVASVPTPFILALKDAGIDFRPVIEHYRNHRAFVLEERMNERRG